jgi:hypothetical protein
MFYLKCDSQAFTEAKFCAVCEAADMHSRHRRGYYRSMADE